ncbi:MAG: methyltransferase domain-containing protein [Clostridiales bacterium]|nr:methyltransferase domain-containing protein [Clostridiales bacterium]
MCGKILFTTQDESAGICLEELKRTFGPGARLSRWLRAGIGILDTDLGFGEFSAVLKNSPPIFLRHIFPINTVIPIGETIESAGELVTFAAGFADGPYSAQARVLDPERYGFTKYELTQAVSAGVSKAGGTLDVRNPVNVISIVVCNSLAYAGVSREDENLSSWPGGMHRFAKYDGQVSRAEFKLLEALDVFGPDLSGFARALDLGAAPGGWSKVMLERGLAVTAVDPAEMSPRILRDKRLTHFKCSAQEFMERDLGFYDLIMNDMRMDATESADITRGLRGRLSGQGLVIITLKLPKRKNLAAAERGLNILRQGYAEVRAKQLFHNRSEITAVCGAART